jgi:glyoxylase-like metal-dependent hydrolase (beta-lactamase superfamily II)
MSMPRPDVAAFFDPDTCSVAYLVSDLATRTAAVIDAVLDYDPKAGRVATRSADRVVAAVKEAGLTVEWVLETHIHADHLAAGAYIKSRLGGRLGIGEHVTAVQRHFTQYYNIADQVPADGSQFDHRFTDGETFRVGGIEARVLHTPGHTPACITYLIGDAAFVGDTIFMPDYGTARCDFPGGSARALHRSIKRLFALPPQTRVFVGHDYAPNDRPYAWETTVAEERERNIHVGGGRSEDDFVQVREERDRGLEPPNLILAAIQVNLRGGRLPEPEANGTAYLKIPLNRL